MRVPLRFTDGKGVMVAKMCLFRNRHQKTPFTCAFHTLNTTVAATRARDTADELNGGLSGEQGPVVPSPLRGPDATSRRGPPFNSSAGAPTDDPIRATGSDNGFWPAICRGF
jgi:hypothetical protein